jgi:hypothetical protein
MMIFMLYVYTRVVVNFMMCLLFKFGGIWPHGLGTMPVLRSVQLQFALCLPRIDSGNLCFRPSKLLNHVLVSEDEM